MDDFGTPRSTISFNALISACNQSKRFDLVPQLFDEIPQRHGFYPINFRMEFWLSLIASLIRLNWRLIH
ncbi:hypothetical protein ACSBR2_024843 [Camellia fascicularis]